MTDTEKLTLLIGVLKTYAEQNTAMIERRIRMSTLHTVGMYLMMVLIMVKSSLPAHF